MDDTIPRRYDSQLCEGFLRPAKKLVSFPIAGIFERSGDRYGGEWPRERFFKAGIAYEPASKSASDLYRDALPLFNSGTVELLDNPTLVAQLCSLERRTSRARRDAIGHPDGGHDDVANAVAGVLTNLTSTPRYGLLDVL